MELTISWSDGETRTVQDVASFTQGWAGDEWVIGIEYRDGERGTFTGQEVVVSRGEEDLGE